MSRECIFNTSSVKFEVSTMAVPKLRLTYFPFQGAAEKVRLALVLGGIDFEDVRVPFPAWPALKPTTPYGQLPLLTIDDGEPLAQSVAMLRYAGRLASTSGKADLYPVGRMLEVDEACGFVTDIERAWRPPVGVGIDPSTYGYAADFRGTEGHAAVVKAVREQFVAEALPKYMEFLGKRLGDDRRFLCGDAPTIADCWLIPILNRFTCGAVDHVPVECLEPFPTVVAYVARFMELDEVKAWYATAE